MKWAYFRAMIAMRKTEEDFSYQNQRVLGLSMIYPAVFLRHNPGGQQAINRQIQREIHDFAAYASQTLYKQAIEDYQQAQANGFPFHPHEALLQYEITYNLNCHLSLYRDAYTYTGGAHGSTLRASDTWSLKSGERLSLSAFFPPGENYKPLLLKEILRQANAAMQQNPGIYFDNYPALIREHFNEESYYLTPEGLAIYFQQYEIAPYATGIVVFTIPYGVLKWHPSCRG